MRVGLLCLLLAGCFTGPGFAGPILFSIGPDSGLSGPSGFYSITSGGTATWLFDLGDGSLGFNGGLAIDPGNGTIYAIANSSLGDSSLVSFSVAGGGVFSTIASLGQGFVSGLAYNSSDGFLYGISSDPMGRSSLNRISTSGLVTTIGVLGTGFYGGLTYRPADGLLYAFSGDASGVQREFQSIIPVTALATRIFELGDGSASFSGGVAYSAADGRFYVVANGASGVSTLQSFTLAGESTRIAISGIGDGFWNVGLGAETPVPEPAVRLPAAVGLLAGLFVRLRKRAPAAGHSYVGSLKEESCQ